MKFLSDIYFLNAKALAIELRASELSEHRAVKHLVVATILAGIGFEMPILVGYSESSLEANQFPAHLFGAVVITGIISYYGVWSTYHINAKGDGKDYFLRFSSLTLPVGIQLVVSFLIIGVILLLLSFLFPLLLLGISSLDSIEIINSFLYILFTVLFFARMRQYITMASGAGE